MARAHILLSDISGIAHEFAFIYERPVVVVDRHLELGGLEGELLGGESELGHRCAEFIVPMSGARIAHAAEELSRVLTSHSVERLRRVRAQTVYNFGTASEIAAKQLIELHERELARIAKPAASAELARESA